MNHRVPKPNSELPAQTPGTAADAFAQQRLAWALAACHEARMRLTSVREAILSFLARQRLPATLDMVLEAEGVSGQRDTTTVYRTLMMFKEAGVVRLVGTPQKVSHFVLNSPGTNNHFLVCLGCGRLAELPAFTILEQLDQLIYETTGCTAVNHDLEVHAFCPACRMKLPIATARETGMTLKLGVKVTNATNAAD